MKTKLVLINLLFFSAIKAQDLNINYQSKFGGSNIDVVYDAVLSPSGDGYYFVGGTRSTNFDVASSTYGNSDVWVIKTDLNYQIQWEKAYGGTENETAKSIKISNNQLYVLAESNSGISGNKTSANYGVTDLWLLALNLNGDILWQNNYGGSDYEDASKMMTLNNGNLLIGSVSSSPVSGNKTTPVVGNINDIWLVEVNYINGDVVRQKNIATNQYDNGFTISRDPFTNEIYLLTDVITGVYQEKTDIGYGQVDLWVAVLDDQLNVVRNKCFGGDQQDGSSASIYFSATDVYFLSSSNSSQSGNKSSLLNGTYSFTNFDYWLIKTDKNWNISWDVSYGGAGTDVPLSVYKGEFNTIALAGNSSSSISGTKTSPKYGMNDYWTLLVNDLDGSLLNQNSYGGTADENVKGFLCTPTNDLLLYGFSDSGISGNKTLSSYGSSDIWILEVETSAILDVTTLNHSEDFKIYPNPTSGILYINLPTELISPIQVYDNSGKLVLEQKSNSLFLPIDLSALDKGTYSTVFTFENRVRIKRIVIQ